MDYRVHQAKTNLSKLLDEAESGKEVTISRRNRLPIRLVAVAEKVKRVPDELKGQITYSPDAFDPLTDEEMKELGFE
jgi:prevent-host-death family protein